MIDLMLPGGEMKKGIDPLEGAKQFIEKYYPNLDSQSVIVKSEILYSFIRYPLRIGLFLLVCPYHMLQTDLTITYSVIVTFV